MVKDAQLRWQRGMHKLRGESDQQFGMVAFISDDPVHDTGKVAAILRQLQGSLDRPD